MISVISNEGWGLLMVWKTEGVTASKEGMITSASSRAWRTSSRCIRELLVMTATGTEVIFLIPRMTSPMALLRVGSPEPEMAR